MFRPHFKCRFWIGFLHFNKAWTKKWACFASLFFLQIVSKFYISLEGPKNTISPSLIEFYPVNKRKTSCEDFVSEKKMMSFGGRHVFKKEIKILAVCHAWNFFALFYYPAVFVACRPKCKIDHLIHCHCGGSICETKKNCMSDFFFILCIPSSYKGGISQSVCHRRWSLYHIWCIFGILLVWFLKVR